jgi:hypothetical protein
VPTNLPPDYFEIEKRFRSAETIEEKIAALQEMYSVVPKHKGTDHLRADLRRRLAKLNEEAQSRKGAGKHDSAFRIPKAGAGQVVVVGPVNVGKSALVAALTGAETSVSSTPHTTWEPLAGMMNVRGIPIQLVDTPSLSRDYVEPRLKELIRYADMVLLVVDLTQDPVAQLKETAILLAEYRVIPRHLQSRYPIDPLLKFLPLLVLVNKCDDIQAQELYQIFCALLEEKWLCLPVSALTGHNLDVLKETIVQELGLIRVYTKAPGKDPDYATPFVMKKGSTVADLAARIHKDFLKKMKSARVWGNAVFDRQLVNRDYVLHDGDVVEIHI